jgi:hypothetical protein
MSVNTIVTVPSGRSRGVEVTAMSGYLGVVSRRNADGLHRRVHKATVHERDGRCHRGAEKSGRGRIGAGGGEARRGLLPHAQPEPCGGRGRTFESCRAHGSFKSFREPENRTRAEREAEAYWDSLTEAQEVWALGRSATSRSANARRRFGRRGAAGSPAAGWPSGARRETWWRLDVAEQVWGDPDGNVADRQPHLTAPAQGDPGDRG